MDTRFDRLSEDDAVWHIVARSQAGHGGWVLNPNVDVLRQIVADPELGRLASQADLVLADGMPLVWASRLLADPLPERVPGSSLLWSLTKAAGAANRSVFILGGAPGNAEKAEQRLRVATPNLNVCGTYCPPFGFEHSAEGFAEIFERLRVAQPDIVFCGLGFPKQERLIMSLVREFPTTWFLAVGAGVDIAAGQFRRAPRWMQRTGLEWLHRLVLEPRRLFRRYVFQDMPFAIRLGLHAAKGRFVGDPTAAAEC